MVERAWRASIRIRALGLLLRPFEQHRADRHAHGGPPARAPLAGSTPLAAPPGSSTCSSTLAPHRHAPNCKDTSSLTIQIGGAMVFVLVKLPPLSPVTALTRRVFECGSIDHGAHHYLPSRRPHVIVSTHEPVTALF